MKYLNIITVLFIASLMTSCSEDVEVVDFSGVYVGPLNCIGAVHQENGTEAIFTITRINEEQYTLDIGDDITYTATQEESVLKIPQQTANEGNGFDEVTFDGEIKKTGLGINAIFTVSVDDEGDSSCDMELIRQ